MPLLVMLLVTVSGCASFHGSPQARLSDDAAAVELTEVPFFPQEEYQCGPAALATVLRWSGIATDPDSLAPALYIPSRKGSLQHELVARARASGRLVYRLPAELSAIAQELEAGNPVLVLQNLGLSLRPFWHYAVVVGYQPDDDSFILRSGLHKRHVTRRGTFYRTWARGEHWAIVVTEPGRIPASAEPESYLQAAFELEQSTSPEQAIRAYRAGTSRWPQNPELALALGNALYKQEKTAEAAEAFSAAIARGADSGVVHNNLAHVLAELGQLDDAEAAAVAAVRTGGVHAAQFHRTLTEIRCLAGRGTCPAD